MHHPGLRKGKTQIAVPIQIRQTYVLKAPAMPANYAATPNPARYSVGQFSCHND